MKKLKKAICLFLAITVAFSLTGCKKEGNGGDEKPTQLPNNSGNTTPTGSNIPNGNDSAPTGSNTPSGGDTASTGDNIVDGGKPAMGRYVEKEVAPPRMAENEYIEFYLMNPEGEMECYTLNKLGDKKVYNRYTYRSGNWESETVEWLNAIKKEIFILQIFYNEGDTYAYYENYEGDQRYYFGKVSSDGLTLEDMAPDEWKNPVTKQNLGNPLMLENKKLLYSDEDGLLFIYDLAGDKKIHELPEQSQKYTSYKNQIFLLNMAGDTIICYDMDTDTILFQEDASSLDISDRGRLFVNEERTLHYINRDGIHVLHNGSTLWETILDGAMSTFGIPSMRVSGFYQTGINEETGNSDFYVFFSSNDSFKKELKYYTYDTTVVSVPSKELTIYSLYDSSTVRQTIGIFQKDNPDVRVRFIIAAGENTGTTLSDNIRALNTELLEGKGADILLLDGLPMDSYIEKNILLDISEWMQPMMDSNELMSNITQCYKQDGKMYALPSRISFPILVGKQDVLSHTATIKELVDVSLQNEEKSVFHPDTNERVSRTLLSAYYQTLLNETGKLDKAKLEEFLKSLQQGVQQKGSLDMSNDRSSDGEEPANFMGEPTYLISNAISSVFTEVKSYWDIMFPFAMRKENICEFQSHQGLFVPNGIIGVTKASKNQDLAKEFVLALFSEEQQTADLLDGFPINTKALKNWENKPSTDSSIGISNDEGVRLSAEWPDSKEKAELSAIINSLKTPVIQDRVLFNILLSETTAFLDGSTTPEETAASIINKVTTYESE